MQKELQSRLLESSWGLHGRPLKAVQSLLRALGGLLDGSWEALGRLLGGSWRLPTGILDYRPSELEISSDFCKKLEFLGVHVGSFLTSKIVFLRFQEGFQDEADF